MRKIDTIILHCTATVEGKDYTVEDIRDWHQRQGWSDIGYHYVIYRDGSVHAGRPVSRVGAHTAGHNTGSIGIVYVGGLANDEDRGPKDTRTMAQKKAMHDLVEDLVHTYPIKRIAGHNEFSNKACPCFNAKQEFEHLT